MRRESSDLKKKSERSLKINSSKRTKINKNKKEEKSTVNPRVNTVTKQDRFLSFVNPDEKRERRRMSMKRERAIRKISKSVGGSLRTRSFLSATNLIPLRGRMNS